VRSQPAGSTNSRPHHLTDRFHLALLARNEGNLRPVGCAARGDYTSNTTVLISAFRCYRQDMARLTSRKYFTSIANRAAWSIIQIAAPTIAIT